MKTIFISGTGRVRGAGIDLTESDSGGSRFTVDPERDPRDDDDEVARQVDLQQVVADLSLQPERHIQHRPRTYNVVDTRLLANRRPATRPR